MSNTGTNSLLQRYAELAMFLRMSGDVRRLLVNHEALRAIREARRLPAQQVARDVEISPQYLCDIENGRRNPRPEVIQRLAEILDVPVGAITHRVVAA